MGNITLMKGANARAYMNYLKETLTPFEMYCSNYTITFKVGTAQKKFVNSMQSNRAFASYAKIKSDVSKKKMPCVDIERLSYFVHDFKEDRYVGNVVNLDIKSAYATVLRNDGYISHSTYNYISQGTKQERLVSVGMLASKKLYFKWENGEVIENDEIVNELSNYFFYAVKRTSEIMSDLKAICGNSYLFTWVDGIYFTPNSKVIRECKEYMKGIAFDYTVDLLKQFNVEVGEKHVVVDFFKRDKSGEWERKPFNLPLINSEFKRIIVDAILSRKKIV